MAQKQLSKPTPVVAQSLKPAQSLELLQTSLRLTVDAILYHRGLFDTALFGFREAPAHFRPKSYKDYVSAPSSVDIPDPVHTYPLLRPKANEGADKFLEWLEVGAFDALRQGYLAAVQIRVLDGQSHSEAMLECHTLKITVKNGDGKSHAVEIRQQSRSHKDRPAYTLGDGYRDMTHNTKDLILYCNKMGMLPSSKNLEMVLYYTDRRPEDWHPRGFIENDTDEVLYFPNNEAWSPNEIVMQNIDTPFHRLSLRARYLIPGANAQSQNPTQNYFIPNGIQGLEKHKPCSALIDDNDVSEARDPEQVSTATEGSFQNEPHDTFCAAASAELPKPNGSCSKNRQSASWVSQDSGQQLELKNMMTKVLPSETCPVTQLPMSTQKHQEQKQVNQTSPISLHDSQRVCFSNETIQQLERRVQPRTKDTIYSCECFTYEDDKMLMRCGYCQEWKHVRCYGYLDDQDPRQPQKHACYTCLLGKGSNASTAQNLATVRRVITTVDDKRPETLGDLTYVSHLDKGVVKRAVEKLVKEGFVKLDKRQHIDPTFISDIGRGNAIREKYFSPATGIQGFLAKPQKDNLPAHSPSVVSSPDELSMSSPSRRLGVSRVGETPARSLASLDRSTRSVPRTRTAQKRLRLEDEIAHASNDNVPKRTRLASGLSKEYISNEHPYHSSHGSLHHVR